MKTASEKSYIRKRIWRARIQSIPFYLCRVLPVNRKKIVFCCIEGTTGYTCNPKYIAEELIRQNQAAPGKEKFELVWLVNDTSKRFPKEIKVIRNTLWKRAYELTTAHLWIDNSRKQLEVRKRKGQIYVQTWHAKLGFKPTCLDRGESFSRIAYLVSKHDSDMIDYVLSNSKWYDDTLPTGMIYNGPVLRLGSPRCDILINAREEAGKRVRELYHLPAHARILMYAPTFRGGSQGTDRSIEVNQGFPDFIRLQNTMQKQFGGEWYMFLRLHPQLAARKIEKAVPSEADSETGRFLIDISKEEDMYEFLAGCDAYMTDYSSAAFDAAVMEIPVLLYADDYAEYEGERGKLLWDFRQLPFPFARNNEELEHAIQSFDMHRYRDGLKKLFLETEMEEDGKAAAHVAGEIRKWIYEK